MARQAGAGSLRSLQEEPLGADLLFAGSCSWRHTCAACRLNTVKLTYEMHDSQRSKPEAPCFERSILRMGRMSPALAPDPPDSKDFPVRARHGCHVVVGPGMCMLDPVVVQLSATGTCRNLWLASPSLHGSKGSGSRCAGRQSPEGSCQRRGYRPLAPKISSFRLKTLDGRMTGWIR